MHGDDRVSAAVSPPVAESDTAGQRQPALHQLICAVGAPATSLSAHDGQIRPGGAQGLYVQDVRVLSELIVTVNGEEPVPIGVDIEGGSHNRFEAAVFNVGSESPDPVIFLTRRRSVTAKGMVEEITFSSVARASVNLRLHLRLACDLADIAAVKSGQRTSSIVANVEGARLQWGAPGLRGVQASGAPAPDVIDPSSGSFAWDLTVAPASTSTVVLSVQGPGESEGVVIPWSHDPHLNDGAGEPISVEASDSRLARLFNRGVADLAGLTMATSLSPDDAFVAAGAPWYLTLFGRDSIWAARMMLPMGTDIALGTLRTLAGRQGSRIDRVSNEEPGKILHELRQQAVRHEAFTTTPGGAAALVLPPVYYGTVDATPLWVCLLHDAWRWGLAESEVEKLLTPLQRCLDWIVDFGCGDRAFVSYVDQSGHGLANQGWKDSFDGIQFRDGRIAAAPIALCEAQGYAYEAAMHGADLLDAFGRPGADRWREFADGLGHRFRQAFWVEDSDGAYPAIALDVHGAPVDSLSSNIGHLLGTGLLDVDEEQLVARRLGEADLNSGFGLRTLAQSSRGYNPLSYHCGSVWTHDTAIAITGLRTVPGREAESAALSLIEGLLRTASHFEYRLPELYGGDAPSQQSRPRAYPASCHPQAWAAASAVAILSAVVGVHPDVPRGTVAFAPLAWPDRLTVRGMRIGDGRVAIQLAPGEPPLVTGLSTKLRNLH
ncbi:MAG: amylo-alpha-1,6-glucosidase [Acidobacteria bacterium]|nr:amylo-alpha-1,6-glucosidase [Acidobacteriota bacterium]